MKNPACVASYHSGFAVASSLDLMLAAIFRKAAAFAALAEISNKKLFFSMGDPLCGLVRVRAASVRRGVAHLLSTHHRPRRACLSGGVPPVAFDASSGSPRSGLPSGRVVGGFYLAHVRSVGGVAGVFNHDKTGGV